MDPLELGIMEQRSIEQACADLRAKREKSPHDRNLARMVEQLEAEVADRTKSRRS
jgi:hypothetical protein